MTAFERIIQVNPAEPTLVNPDAPRDLDTVAEEVRETWLRGAMDRLQAGKEIPVVDVPRALGGESAVISEAATDDLYHRAQTRRYTVNVDIRHLEAIRAARIAADIEMRALVATMQAAVVRKARRHHKRGARKGS